MGFLDHLFKLKQSDEKMGEGEKSIAAVAGANSGPAEAAPDPGAFLHPKNFGPRGGGLYPPVRPTAPNARPPEPPRAHEIVLTLGDVLSRIPTPLLRAGLHDASRELRFFIDDLSADIARGRAAVPLSKIAALCPDVFAREIAPGDDTEIRLPLQKLVEQIGLMRARTAVPASEPAAPEAAPAQDSPPTGEDRSPSPPTSDSPAAPALPLVHVFTPPPPQVIAQPAAAAPPENHSPDPEPGAAPPDAPTAANENLPALRLHPPPVVRPILVPPPTPFATSGHPLEPLVSSIPSPPVEIAHPPEAPAEHPPRFPQEALQALFMTDEMLDLAAISRRTAALPGVSACALEWRGEKALAGNAPDGFDFAAMHTAAARMHDAGTLPIGILENVALHGDQAAISIFTRPGVLLAVLHRPLPPGVRERLATLAAALARP